MGRNDMYCNGVNSRITIIVHARVAPASVAPLGLTHEYWSITYLVNCV